MAFRAIVKRINTLNTDLILHNFLPPTYEPVDWDQLYSRVWSVTVMDSDMMTLRKDFLIVEKAIGHINQAFDVPWRRVGFPGEDDAYYITIAERTYAGLFNVENHIWYLKARSRRAEIQLLFLEHLAAEFRHWWQRDAQNPTHPKGKSKSASEMSTPTLETIAMEKAAGSKPESKTYSCYY